jgi:hypothetical protein
MAIRGRNRLGQALQGPSLTYFKSQKAYLKVYSAIFLRNSIHCKSKVKFENIKNKQC